MLGHGENKWRDAAQQADRDHQDGRRRSGRRGRRRTLAAGVQGPHGASTRRRSSSTCRSTSRPGRCGASRSATSAGASCKEALTTLTEIENMFPTRPPRAAWHKAATTGRPGDRKNAHRAGARGS